MPNTITTNEWYSNENHKPWRYRFVLCRMEDGTMRVCSWNGMYWVGMQGVRVAEEANKITHFYIFEKFNENDILP